MKEIIAIIRMNKVNQTKKALMKAGFSSITARKVMGRGKKKIDYSLVEKIIGNENPIDLKIGEQVAEGHKLIAKRIFTMIVDNKQVKAAVDTIINTNSTGYPGTEKYLYCLL